MEKERILGFVCCAVSGLIVGNVCRPSLFCFLAIVLAITGGWLVAR